MRLGKVSTFDFILSLGYDVILEASEEGRGTDFSVGRKALVKFFRSNKLRTFYSLLSEFLITQSAEAKDLVREKARSRSSSPKKKARVTNKTEGTFDIYMEQHDNTITEYELHRLPQSSHFDHKTGNAPSTPVGNNRVLSLESLGSSSTETTPTKINHPEPLTQNLQNVLIQTLINEVWLGGADVPWARGRRMYLDYRPYHPNGCY